VHKLIPLTALLIPAALLLSQTSNPTEGAFLEKPYLQLGDSPQLMTAESLVLMWQTADASADWKVEVRDASIADWRAVETPAAHTIAVPGIRPHLVYRAHLTGLAPGQEFHYRVLKSGKAVFESAATARKSFDQPYHLVLFGDCAAGTPSQRAIAYRASLEKPDFIFIPGDIVYSSGRISEYRQQFYPVYNAESASLDAGAPLLRSTPFIAAPGNHDTALSNFEKFADALAYFFYWDQPMNGPIAPDNAARARHLLTGNNDAQPAFLDAAKPHYPRMANFSFDYGNAHWTVLDSNPYMDWTNPSLRDWVAQDLEAARGATWRFVGFHHPGFNSSKTHFTDQWMRVLSPVFEAGRVDIVFAGHVHNYQRSFPLLFAPVPQPDDQMFGPKGEVRGEYKFDKDFADGVSGAKPKGVIYIVSGAGGAGLYDTNQQADPKSWQPFTYRYVADEHSFSVIDVKGRTFHLKQISESGKEVDSFQIIK
jgi:3',5'-cyclic AMP phosphodiesterase CpdA